MRDSLYSNQTAEREATRQQQATQLRRGMVDAIIDAEARRVRVRFANDEHVEATVTTAHVGDGWLPAVETPVLVDTDDGGTPLVVGSGTNVTVDDGTPAAVGERTIGHSTSDTQVRFDSNGVVSVHPDEGVGGAVTIEADGRIVITPEDATSPVLTIDADGLQFQDDLVMTDVSTTTDSDGHVISVTPIYTNTISL